MSERAPPSPEKKARVRPSPGKAVFALYIASFFVRLIFSGRLSVRPSTAHTESKADGDGGAEDGGGGSEGEDSGELQEGFEVVWEISPRVSFDLGKATHLQKIQKPLFGRSIIKSNGAEWAHQRKIIAPEFFLDKVKGMVDLMVESAMPLLKS